MFPSSLYTLSSLVCNLYFLLCHWLCWHLASCETDSECNKNSTTVKAPRAVLPYIWKHFMTHLVSYKLTSVKKPVIIIPALFPWFIGIYHHEGDTEGKPTIIQMCYKWPLLWEQRHHEVKTKEMGGLSAVRPKKLAISNPRKQTLPKWIWAGC